MVLPVLNITQIRWLLVQSLRVIQCAYVVGKAEVTFTRLVFMLPKNSTTRFALGALLMGAQPRSLVLLLLTVTHFTRQGLKNLLFLK